MIAQTKSAPQYPKKTLPNWPQSWFLPAGQFMAADGDDVIGLAAVGLQPDNTMVNLITGVDRAYRGRKIAQALKLLTIRFAK